jgi:hypothetical protein
MSQEFNQLPHQESIKPDQAEAEVAQAIVN